MLFRSLQDACANQCWISRSERAITCVGQGPFDSRAAVLGGLNDIPRKERLFRDGHDDPAKLVHLQASDWRLCAVRSFFEPSS